MTLLSALARLEAARTGHAQPLAAFRHRHLADRPLVLVPLMLTGEAGAPLAVITGTSRNRAQVLTVPQPRNRDQRFTFAADLADLVTAHIDTCRTERRAIPAARGREERSRFADAPQILVPNSGGIRALAQLGRATRYRDTHGPYAVPENVPRLGRWLTFLSDRAEHTGSALLTAVTDLLCEQWATGQSPLEDRNLHAVLGWIDPPDGMSGIQAALTAEDPLLVPPAGPTTDPGFDNAQLAPAIAAYDRARAANDHDGERHATEHLTEILTSQLRPTWEAMWNAIALLRALPEAPRADARWAADCEEFTLFSDHLDAGGSPQPRRDYPISAALRLARLERAQADYDAQRALDDPFVMADRRTTGEAFGGTVIAVEPDRTDVSDKGNTVLRPCFSLHSQDPLRIAPGVDLASPTRPAGHKTRIRTIERDGDTSVVTLEVVVGMGTVKKPNPQRVPELGAEVCFTPAPGYRGQPTYPPPGQTPWTHGGPPDPASPAAHEDPEEWDA